MGKVFPSSCLKYGQRLKQSGIISIFKHLDPDFDTKRICLKIPSTWEGLQACKFLEKDGITTLATTLFSIEQAALAGEVQCTYVAPYVNELKVHFDAGYIHPFMIETGSS